MVNTKSIKAAWGSSIFIFILLKHFLTFHWNQAEQHRPVVVLVSMGNANDANVMCETGG